MFCQHLISRYRYIGKTQISVYLLFKSRVRHFFCKALQSCNLPAARARELFKPSTDSASLLVVMEKKLFALDVGFLEVASQ